MRTGNRTPFHSALAAAFHYGLGLAALVFAALLFWQAAHFPASGQAWVAAGPLRLMSIEKTPVSPGEARLSFSWVAGSAWYFGLSFLAAGAAGWIAARRGAGPPDLV